MDYTELLTNYIPTGISISVILFAVFHFAKVSNQSMQHIVIALVAALFVFLKNNLLYASADIIADAIVSWAFSITFYEIVGKNVVKKYFDNKNGQAGQ